MGDDDLSRSEENNHLHEALSGSDEDNHQHLHDIASSSSTRSTQKKTRGLTRMTNFLDAIKDSKCKYPIHFNDDGTPAGKNPIFATYLGDLVRRDVGLKHTSWKSVPKGLKDILWDQITTYFEIDDCWKKYVMVRLGALLRGFRGYMFHNFVAPKLKATPGAKLDKVPEKYSTMITQEEWDSFVKFTCSKEFQAMSVKGKASREKSQFPHNLGRAGYAGLRDRLTKQKKFGENEDPKLVRSILWRKARQNKHGNYATDSIKDVADKLIAKEKEIEDGEIELDPVSDALTLILGKDHSGFLRGVGTGVTASKYWSVPRNRVSSQERIAELQSQLDGKEGQIGRLLKKYDRIAAHFTKLGKPLPDELSAVHRPPQTSVPKSHQHVSKVSQKPTPTMGSLKDTHKSDRSTRGQTKVVDKGILKDSKKNNTSTRVEKSGLNDTQTSDASTPAKRKAFRKKDNRQQIDASAEERIDDGQHLKKPKRCKLGLNGQSNIVAEGEVHYMPKDAPLHGMPLPPECYRVSIHSARKEFAFLPYPTGGMKLVGEAVGSFVAWDKSSVDFIRSDGEPPNKQPKIKQKKRKNI
ncbi:hypothetical protein OROMI_017432 [Orobanche minor]